MHCPRSSAPMSSSDCTARQIMPAIAPFWLDRVWFLDLVSLLEGSPWRFKCRGQAFTIDLSFGTCGQVPATDQLIDSG